jgi:hypothetical protein
MKTFKETKGEFSFEQEGSSSGLSPTELLQQRNDLLEILQKSKRVIGSLRRSITCHPDCLPNSEFDDFGDMAQETEDEIELIVNKITE